MLYDILQAENTTTVDAPSPHAHPLPHHPGHPRPPHQPAPQSRTPPRIAPADFPLFATPDGLTNARRGIALEQIYRALAHLRHPAGQRAVADFDGPEALKGAWRNATQRRNQSILAHGLQPVGPDGFAILATLVADYTGQDTTRIDLDAPAWDLAWFA